MNTFVSSCRWFNFSSDSGGLEAVAFFHHFSALRIAVARVSRLCATFCEHEHNRQMVEPTISDPVSIFDTRIYFLDIVYSTLFGSLPCPKSRFFENLPERRRKLVQVPR